MWCESENVLFWLSVLVQAIGICGVVAARLTRLHRAGDRGVLGGSNGLVLICFLFVGIASACLMQAGSGCWLAFATTMPLMAIGATLDLKKQHRTAAF